MDLNVGRKDTVVANVGRKNFNPEMKGLNIWRKHLDIERKALNTTVYTPRNKEKLECFYLAFLHDSHISHLAYLIFPY